MSLKRTHMYKLERDSWCWEGGSWEGTPGVCIQVGALQGRRRQVGGPWTYTEGPKEVAAPAQAGNPYLEALPRPRRHTRAIRLSGLATARAQRSETWDTDGGPEGMWTRDAFWPSELRPVVFIEHVVYGSESESCGY